MSEVKWTFLIVTDQITADIYQSLLESNDIPVFLRSDVTRTVHPFTVEDVEVMVPEDKFEEAQGLIENVEIIVEEEEDGCGDCGNCSEDCPFADEE